MSLSACQWMFLRPLIFIFLVVTCVVFFFMKHGMPDMIFPSFDMYTERGNPSCPTVVCPVIRQTQDLKQNCSSEPLITQQPTVIPTEPVDTEPDTIVLMWMYPFGIRFDLNCDSLNIKKCHLTDDKSMYSKAHAVMFHHRDIDLKTMPKEPRPWFQKWVWLNMECPSYCDPIDELNHSFNLTCNYRLDSSIPVPYGRLQPLAPGDADFKLPEKNKLVCWIVSNWNPSYKRVQFYNELSKYIKIEGFGRGLNKRISAGDYENIVSSCKFYLSFENSVYKDYITEKLFRPMLLGTVPVVLGSPRKNYEKHVPADSFIHVDDFPSPKELAERLLYLDQHDSQYMKYFKWRKWYKSEDMYTQFGRVHACMTCRYLQTNKQHQIFHDLNNWFWGV